MSNAAGSKWIRPAKRLALYARDGLACVYCGKDVESAMLSLDHILPRELGGGHEATNLVTCCLGCNGSRKDMPMRAWLRVLRSRGIDTTGMALKVRTLAARPFDIQLGKQMLAARKAA
jgi:5-methylcytosine-specific restriction endonuclease McrA